MTPAEIDQYMNMFLILAAVVGAGYMAWRLMKPKPVITEKKVPQRPINVTREALRREGRLDETITDYDEVPKNREMARPTLRMPQSSKSFKNTSE